tara:strand:- start:69 stop:281 length:213 start_codon:yes stop_codon:yes gene_type:complete
MNYLYLITIFSLLFELVAAQHEDGDLSFGIVLLLGLIGIGVCCSALVACNAYVSRPRRVNGIRRVRGIRR